MATARYSRRREAAGFDAQTRVPIPESMGGGPWRELLSGRELAAQEGTLDPRTLFSHLPVAVLVAP